MGWLCQMVELQFLPFIYLANYQATIKNGQLSNLRNYQNLAGILTFLINFPEVLTVLTTELHFKTCTFFNIIKTLYILISVYIKGTMHDFG